ncbi:hypothetical protein [Streptosporangium saharense]|uniref:Uncharacterized protein n=1 Tax=Streptosporangium saharense TaxID=1706840 RepID=A0A7W7QSB8_9ACTN|nr:hypothetical protein [Streptosporangium saharense]MBB4918846.1 hypothetical protein [Streptosporangium saharense]
MSSSPDKQDAPERIAARVELLRSDVRRLADCAERLRRVEAELDAGGAAPPWLRETVRAHLEACAVAAADLAEAEARLSRYAERLGA